MKIQIIIFRIKRRLGLVSAKAYLNHLRTVGIKIGRGTVLFSSDIMIDEQRPWMVEIGEYCKITKGAVILQHDYSRSVLRRVYGEVIGESKKTIIGNNVFIGMNAIILMGAHIGNNVIVGAGSVVSGVIVDNVVVAGNPAKIVKTLEQHYQRRKEKYVEEAMETLLAFRSTYGRLPTISEMGSFWPLYLAKEKRQLASNHIQTNLSGDVEQEIIDCWLQSTPLFSSFQAFVQAALAYEKNQNDILRE